ncbi:cryptic beta-D-galactosidase subunit beta [Anaerobiospirillum thomasii]|uniref:Cryptic beta-D-galactosidase subunit beta n=1 Tax=Anaerobiospirillum thomasii TaxID=179995 RepID=A0A2X0WUN4_9GAMM|nr:YhcH/YjgK/YiaL family protein [Anaerobiospirillum thomasii]SPT67744.1 cryptic beta-D-galactosidase subunit beta [Anaerobiospirillum thomasii]SPT70202.1 cryptic beta-D-galactosidase subunit beta [Anaerobiospirillum thomasii]
MLVASLKLAKKYDYLEDKFTKAYDWLANTDIKSLENGRYDICEGVFALVQRYKTVQFDEIRFEAHNDYFDIQYMAEGEESFGYALRSELEKDEDCPDVDCYFFKTPKFYTQVNLKEGDLAVVPPEEAHQPRVAYKGEPKDVTKVVVKVAV